jgi:putative FmdB family regulatory protein
VPIYEYRCMACACQLEVIQKVSDAPLTHCPECDKNNLEKIISATQFQLKGTGWYVTDYARKGSQQESNEKASVSASDAE